MTAINIIILAAKDTKRLTFTINLVKELCGKYLEKGESHQFR